VGVKKEAISWDGVKEDKLIEGMKRRIVTGEKAMLGCPVFPKGAKVPTHSDESEQITNVLTGVLTLLIE
jgi:hypothetical protein